ncbi:MAG: superoxide dismutase [Calditrichaceae bacterium]|nr:superoxide dismutase [Calditrichaceae bacterium]MBN2710373.1 superoxide dismutase [Calditrichaceae bacterium]
MAHKLNDLGYAFDALEPFIDAQTMEIHHDKHHAAYVNNLNTALEQAGAYKSSDLDELITQISKIPEAARTGVRNNGGGHWNHSFFWTLMKKNENGRPAGKLADAINKDFGSFEKFKEDFKKAGATRFGSGWAWLIINQEGKLAVCSTPNQDNPLMDIAEVKGQPILAVDVWEHAYYLKYQNRRPDYLEAFFNVVNWDKVSGLYETYK